MSTEKDVQEKVSETSQQSQSVPADVMPPDYFPMRNAPKDGRMIEILFRHYNFQYAKNEDKHIWQQWCKARWTDFNGGGWVWHGICGNPICWRYAV